MARKRMSAVDIADILQEYDSEISDSDDSELDLDYEPQSSSDPESDSEDDSTGSEDQARGNQSSMRRGVVGRRGRVRGRMLGNRRGVPAARGRGNDVEEWSDVDGHPNIPIFSGAHGIVNVEEFNDSSEVFDFFYHFIDLEIINHMKEQTNLYAREMLAKKTQKNTLSAHSRLRKWKTCTQADIRRFLAIIIHMSICHRPSIADHWSQNPVLSCNFCPKVLSRDRFLAILGNFHLADNRLYKQRGEPGHDPLHKLRPLIDSLQNKFQVAYIPDECLTVDEGMCPFRGRFRYRVYMPKKPNKYRIKLYMLSEAKSGYVWNFDIFCGQENTGQAIIQRLLHTRANQGHTIYTDRFYTSIALAKQLEGLQTGFVGTVMKNRRGLPHELLNARLSRGEQIFRRLGNILALRWRDKRDVLMVSTRHAGSMVTYTDRQGREKTKPAAVVSYNKNKFGVDLSDQLMSYGAFSHKAVKWWRSLAFHLILMTLVNASIMYNAVHRTSMPVSRFMQQVCTQLVMIEEDDEQRTAPSAARLGRLSEKHFLERIPIPSGQNKAQKRCKVCYEKGKKETGIPIRKLSSHQCSACKIGFCVDPCFKLFHSKRSFV